MAMRSLLARTTTTTLCRARAPSSGPVCASVPRLSPASSSRRYTSQGGYGRNWDKEFDRHRTDEHLNELREARSDKILSFVVPVAIVLGLGIHTTACLTAGYHVGLFRGYYRGFVHGIKALNALDAWMRKVIDKLEELDIEVTDGDIDEAMTAEVANSKDDDNIQS